VNTESLELATDADRFVLYVRTGLGCAILGLVVAGRLMGLL
jgi:hypothetical protein